jgi:D-alanyl-D-alanine carboxypeptidase
MIQAVLKAKGFSAGAADSVFGRATTNAVRGFQDGADLPVTGIVDEATGRALGLPFWNGIVRVRLDPPYRDAAKFPAETTFEFQSLTPEGWASSWAHRGYQNGNPLTLRAVRTNNPGAVNISTWQRNLMKGYVGKTEPDNSPNRNETTIYLAPEYGVAMWGYLLRIRYFRGRRDPVTLRQIIEKYRGGLPPQPYLDGYRRFSQGVLSGNSVIDLYDNHQLAVLAIAAYSHELGFWWPLSDAQMQNAFAITDEYSRAFERQNSGDGPPFDATLNDEADTPQAIGNEEVFYDGEVGMQRRE